MKTCIFLVGSLLVIGCGKNDPAPPASSSAVAKEKVLLAQEPAGAKGVIEVKKSAQDGNDVVVVGRIGGGENPFTGRASFTIVDASFKPCNERGDDACPTPWDYCCDPPDDLVKGTVLVKFVDAAGKTLAQDAKSWLGVRELQTVVVRGQVKRDDAGAFTVVAAGMFVK